MRGENSSVPNAKPAVPDWNVIVTLSEPTFRIARKLLARWGRLRHTEYHNVEVMAVADPVLFFRSLPLRSNRCRAMSR